MTEKEREIYAMLLQICYEILPNTSMRNNKKIKEVLDLVKEHLQLKGFLVETKVTILLQKKQKIKITKKAIVVPIKREPVSPKKTFFVELKL